MAVYTDVGSEELEEFLADYTLGTLLSCKGIAEGVENSNFLLQTSTGFSILTLYEKRVNADDLPFFLSLMEYLGQRGLVCPQPVRQRGGQMLGVLSGRPAAIVTFLDGVSVRRPQVAHCAQLGQALARLHLAGAGFPHHRPNALSCSGWQALYRAVADRADGFSPGLRALLERELAFLTQNWPDDLPCGVIHADLFPDNVFFIGNQLSGLIDFYFSCTDLLAYDLAICLNAWCFETDGAFNITKTGALLDAYQRVRPLDPAERARLPLLARGAAVRFLLTRLTDWLNVPEGALVKPKDPMEYVRKLRFHQQVSHVRDYGLFS